MSMVVSYSNLAVAPQPLPIKTLVGDGMLDASATFTRLTGNASYFDATPTMQFAAANVPRWDHDPLTGAPLGLLIEQQSTNLVKYSHDPSKWTYASSPLDLATYGTAPDGTTAQKTIVGATANPNGMWRIGTGLTPASAGPQVGSIFFAPAGYSYAQEWSFSAGDTTARAFNLTTGASMGGNYTATTRCANGWMRCAADIPYNQLGAVFCASATYRTDQHNGTGNGIGDGVSGVGAWGWQIENTAVPTSYIPTNGAAATRAKETLTYPAPAEAGTILLDHDAEAGASLINTNSTDILTSQGAGKIAIAWDASGTSVCYNGGAVTHGAAITWGSDYELLKNANAHIKPNGALLHLRKLSDAELQAATA